jgi:hypothetical protein
MARKKSPSPLPSATIYGANINEFVAWDGQRYVLRPTRDSILADDSLRLIGSVRELSRFIRRGPGYVFVPDPWEHVCSPRDTADPHTTPQERFQPKNDDYQVVELDGQSYDLTPYESKILRLLHKAHLEKRGSVGIGEIKAALAINSGKMSDWFRKKKPLKKIILHTGRQHYRLEL